MIPLLLAGALCVLAYVLTNVFAIPSWRTIRLFNKLPGPMDQPFFLGMAWSLRGLDFTEFIPYIKGNLDKFGGYYAVYFMGQPTVVLADAEVAEVLLTSTKNIDKGPDYRFIGRWLQNGLLNSTGDKWRRRRKMLTPSFHFKILEDNMECMNRNFKKVVEKFLIAKGSPLEPLPVISRRALDIICETAMGTILDKDARGEEYVGAVKRVTQDSVTRAINPLLWNDYIFNLTSLGQNNTKDISILHGFTENVIHERKNALKEQQILEASECSVTDGKRRQVFLDSLLDISTKENLSDDNIREEVDTFMFAGHDTTSTALQYMLLHLAENPEVQEKAYREQLDIFGYSDRDATKEDLSQMHYLEQVIKESLRLHPPAPQIARMISEDIKLPDGKLVPAGTKVLINIFLLHRNPKYFSDPEAFKPERFSLEETKNRHSYAYIPFSAGPRNCIGQKFAMMEMKIGASTILRSCKISSITKTEDLKYKMLVILQPSTPVRVEVTARNIN